MRTGYVSWSVCAAAERRSRCTFCRGSFFWRRCGRCTCPSTRTRMSFQWRRPTRWGYCRLVAVRHQRRVDDGQSSCSSWGVMETPASRGNVGHGAGGNTWGSWGSHGSIRGPWDYGSFHWGTDTMATAAASAATAGTASMAAPGDLGSRRRLRGIVGCSSCITTRVGGRVGRCNCGIAWSA